MNCVQCGGESKPFRKGLCNNCYQIFNRKGTFERLPRGGKKQEPKLCTIEDCNKNATAHGLCSTHYRRLLRNGNPLTVKKRGKQPKNKKEL